LERLRNEIVKLDKVCRAFVAATLTGLVVAGCGSDNNLGGKAFTPGAATGRVNCGGKNQLTAEGSTAQENAMTLFNQAWGRLCPGKKVAYDPTGSGAGREQFVYGHVDFAGADAPLETQQIELAVKRCQGNAAWHLPMVFGPIAVAYHLHGVNPLVVNADMLAKIFSGAITMWDDPAVAALNRGVSLPKMKIVPIYRSDSSGTTDNFQRYLTSAAPQAWTKGVGTEFQGGVGEGAQRSAGLLQAVQSTPGAIGYVEKSFADQAGVPYAQIDSGSGAVALTEGGARKAIDDAMFAGQGNDLVLDLDSMYAMNKAGVYPLILATYEIVCSKGYDHSTSAAVTSFLTVAASNGQSGLSPAGYVPLPNKFKERLLTAISAIQ
jgi:phosphate transport system substrate-binding protein